MKRSTMYEASYQSEFANTVIVGVRFVDDRTNLFSKKTYYYFYSSRFIQEDYVGNWLEVVVNKEIKNVFVITVLNTSQTDIPLKSIRAKVSPTNNNALNAMYSRAITRFKLEYSTTFGASIHSQIDAMCNDGSIIDYKHQNFVLDEACLAKSSFISNDKIAELIQPKPKPKENTMHPFKLITKTFVSSADAKMQDVTTLTDDEIFDLIAQAEAEIAKLEAIKTKPKKLQQRINDLQAGITEITAYLDAKA